MEQEHAKGIPHLEIDELDAKAVEFFGGKIVRKDLTSMMKRGANVPTFVLEYLLGMYCATDDEEMVEEGVARIRKILTENYVRADESETIKSKIRELGQYTIIDKVHAKLDEYKDIYVASFTNLAIEPFVMPAEYVPPRSSARAMSRLESDSITSGAKRGSPPNQVTVSLFALLASSMRSARATTSSCTSGAILPLLWFSKQ